MYRVLPDVLLHNNDYVFTFHVLRTCIEFYQICFTAQQWLCVYIPCAPNMYKVLPDMFYCTMLRTCIEFYQICFTAQQWLCVYIPDAPNKYKVLPDMFYCTSSTRSVLLHSNGYQSTFHVLRTCIEFYQICFTAQQWLCVYIPDAPNKYKVLPDMFYCTQWLCVYIPCAPNMYRVLPYLFYCTAMAMSTFHVLRTCIEFYQSYEESHQKALNTVQVYRFHSVQSAARLMRLLWNLRRSYKLLTVTIG
ncbi:hypothetical protein RRG08_013236 [Elysia crispata]|uniref:Uncharacterized protein n=1 Tax=Elysia crispata TaxID=231223 RepID=A0AAE1AHI1_9GAST|nr:hypothetical protein RRG08_013236 [Elysia crispata]